MNALEGVKEEQKDDDDSVKQVDDDDLDKAAAPAELSSDDIGRLEGERSKDVEASAVDKRPKRAEQ